jgi:hypothetical protein
MRYAVFLLHMATIACSCIDSGTQVEVAAAHRDLLKLAQAVISASRSLPATGSTLVPFPEQLRLELVARGHGAAIKRDPWGKDVLLWSDGVHFVLVSGGPDGRIEYDYPKVWMRFGLKSAKFVCNDAFAQANDDVLVIDGIDCSLLLLDRFGRRLRDETSNHTLHPTAGVRFGADFRHAPARRG